MNIIFLIIQNFMYFVKNSLKKAKNHPKELLDPPPYGYVAVIVWQPNHRPKSSTSLSWPRKKQLGSYLSPFFQNLQKCTIFFGVFWSYWPPLCWNTPFLEQMSQHGNISEYVSHQKAFEDKLLIFCVVNDWCKYNFHSKFEVSITFLEDLIYLDHFHQK